MGMLGAGGQFRIVLRVSGADKRPVKERSVQEFMDQMDLLVRSRYPAVYVVTWEEERLASYLREIARRRRRRLFVWTVTQGRHTASTAGFSPP